MISKILTTVFLLFFITAIQSQTVNFRVSTSFYSWRTADSITSNTTYTTHVKGYQNLLFDVSYGKIGINFSTQIDEDIVKKIGRGFSYRFYNLYIKGSNLFNVLDFRLGRHYLSAGVGKGAIDGLSFKIKAGKKKEIQFTGYGGIFTPLNYDFDNYSSIKIKDNYFVGGQIAYYGVKDLGVSISYTNKHKKPVPYTADRLDSFFNTKSVTIDIDSRADQLAGLDFSYSYGLKFYISGKAYYDLNLKKFSRGEAYAKVSPMNNLWVNASYTYTEPLLSYNTIFWVFEHKQYQEIGLGADYLLKKTYNLFIKFGTVLFNEKDTSNSSFKLDVGFNHPNYGLSYTRYFKYAGESDGVYGYYTRDLLKSKLACNLSLAYSRYRISEYSTEKVNSFSGILGFTYRPIPQFSVDVQGQVVINRIYKTDTRAFVGFNYWLFKNFK
jgi:hypothetical protein